MIDLYFLTPAEISQISYPTTELVIATGIPANKVNTKIKTQPPTVEPKISKFST